MASVSEVSVQSITKIAILGGGLDELNILSEFHRTPDHDIIAIYDSDPMAVALEIAEILGVPTYTDDTFLAAFREADYIIVSERRKHLEREIKLLQKVRQRIINPSEAFNYLSGGEERVMESEQPPWPVHLEEALKYINRITDRERLLKWLLEISVRAVGASSGSIMLYTKQTNELYIGYAIGLSQEVVKNTRQGMGEGIAGKAAETGNTQLIRELLDIPLYKGGRDREEIQSAIVAPLRYQGNLLGVLNISTNRGEKKLTEDDTSTIELLSTKIAPILEQHMRIDSNEIRELEFQIRHFLESLFHKNVGFHEKFTFLSKFLAEKLEADTVTIYTATDEGDWLILGGSDQHVSIGVQSPRVHCIKGSLARAYLSGEEILMTEASHDAGLKLKATDGAITSIYIPLVHNEPLGVILIEISRLDAFERFYRLKDSLRFQVGFFTYSQLRDIRQSRKMDCLEKLSSFTPNLINVKELPDKIKQLPSMISTLLNASMGSIHYNSTEVKETAYFGFPDSAPEREKRIEYDTLVMEQARSNREPSCISYLSDDVDMYEKTPLYRSVIVYPMLHEKNIEAVYIGYDKSPINPLDSSIFGEHDIKLLRKVSALLEPIFVNGTMEKQKSNLLTFNGLLKSNQKIFIERIQNEIDRAARYHHGFTVTLFKINGLSQLFNKNYNNALDLINELSVGVRKQVRKSDYFSWIEVDLFGVLSLESYQRIGYLEDRINGFITTALKSKMLYDYRSFFPSSGYALFPGSSETPGKLISEAKDKL